MKAILLSAGKGSRLGALTKDTPKCLLPVGKRTMLDHWFQLLGRWGVKDILINTHFCHDKVVDGCKKYLADGFRITFAYEKELLGTGKSVYAYRNFVKDERYFLIIYTDTWMSLDLRAMIKFQKRRKGIGTLGIYKPVDLSDQGSIQVSGRNILGIEEKAKEPKGKYAFAGIMVGSNTMFRFYNDSMVDLVGDWLPVIKNGLSPYFIEGEVLDIGTPQRYKVACDKVKGMALKFL